MDTQRSKSPTELTDNMTSTPEIQELFDASPHIWENRTAYQKIRQQLEKEHYGKVVLMHKGQVTAIYNDRGDAYTIGCEKFGLGHFYLKTIGERPVSLGIQALCINAVMQEGT